jgi:hypothetical protein
MLALIPIIIGNYSYLLKFAPKIKGLVNFSQVVMICSGIRITDNSFRRSKF